MLTVERSPYEKDAAIDICADRKLQAFHQFRRGILFAQSRRSGRCYSSTQPLAPAGGFDQGKPFDSPSRNKPTRSGQAMAAEDEVEMREASSKRTFEEEIQSISDECVRDVREICAGMIEKTRQVAEDVRRLNARADRLLLQAEILAEHWRDIPELERRFAEIARPE